jgi:hypothetical protein
MENARPRQRRHTCNRNFKQPNFRSGQPPRTRHRGRWPLQPVDPARTLIAPCLAHGALTDGRVFHLGPHRVQIVRGRDHRKQQNQHTSQGQQTLHRTHPARQSCSRAPPPQPVSRQRQQHPRQIEQQFHTSQSKRAQTPHPTRTRTLVLQKPQTQVNMTTVPPRYRWKIPPLRTENWQLTTDNWRLPYGPTTTCSAAGVCICCL